MHWNANSTSQEPGECFLCSDTGGRANTPDAIAEAFESIAPNLLKEVNGMTTQ